MMNGKTICVLLVVVLVLSGVVLADIKLPSVIGDNMVLQRGGSVPIWGWADPCEQIVIKYGIYSRTWSAVADANGRWETKIGPFDAVGVGMDLKFEGKNTIVLKNVIVGEVWVCSGQSNMELTVSNSVNAGQEIAEANNYPQIRMFTVGKNVKYTPMANCQGHWLVCSSHSVVGFSAVGYFFGRELNKQLNVPIGLINTSWGGTPAESWTSKEYLEGDAELKPILTRYEETVAKIPEIKEQYKQEIQKYEESAAKLKAEGKPVPPRPKFEQPIGPGHQYSPTGLFNGMVAPLIPYSIRGAIWYQGEANAERAYQYRRLFPTMIKCWREKWGQGDFPFLFVQLANFMAVNPEPGESEWAELREAQLMTLSAPNTGMAVIIDIGDANNIHPKNKQDVGRRLALWALAKTYGKDMVYSGPIYKSMEVRGNSAILHFESVGGGLVVSTSSPQVAGKGELLKGFAVAGADHKFVWADAKIEDDTVVVSSDKVSEPVAVRYGWADNPICNLYNKEGLPATPLRTDNWPGLTDSRR
jgi:sialate O-acetylesterase